MVLCQLVKMIQLFCMISFFPAPPRYVNLFSGFSRCEGSLFPIRCLIFSKITLTCRQTRWKRIIERSKVGEGRDFFFFSLFLFGLLYEKTQSISPARILLLRTQVRSHKILSCEPCPLSFREAFLYRRPGYYTPKTS